MENGSGHHKNYAFGEFDLETELQTLRCGAAEIHIAKRPFDVLLFLIENRERVVSRNELLSKFWEGHDVYDDALRKCVGAIRKALDDTEKSPHFVETRRGSGYRFIGRIEEDGGQEVSSFKFQVSGENELDLTFRKTDFLKPPKNKEQTMKFRFQIPNSKTGRFS